LRFGRQRTKKGGGIIFPDTTAFNPHKSLQPKLLEEGGTSSFGTSINTLLKYNCS